jgi:chemotaxis protein CheX
MSTYKPNRFHWIAKDELTRRVNSCIREILNDVAKMDVTPEFPSTHPNSGQAAITAIVMFEGNYRGFVSLHCPEALAQRIASGLAGTCQDSILADVRDGLGEVINILGSDVKLFLSPSGKTISLSPPFVFCGEQHDYHFTNYPESLCCSFLDGEERLVVGVMVEKQL